MIMDDLPLPLTWRTATGDQASFLAAVADDQLAVRFDDRVAIHDATTGACVASAELEHASVPAFLVVAGGVILTDTRGGPDRTTVVTGIRDGARVFATPVDARIARRGASMLGDELFVLGDDRRGGPVLRSLDLSGARRLDARVTPDGRDLATHGGELLVLSSTGEPGISRFDAGGRRTAIVEATPVQEMRVDGDHLLAAARTSAAPAREIKLHALTSGELRWAHAGHGALLALDAELALHAIDDPRGLCMVARDVTTGAERWRSEPLADDSGEIVCSRLVIAFNHGTGVTLYGRTDGAVRHELPFVRAFDVAGTLYLSDLESLARPRIAP